MDFALEFSHALKETAIALMHRQSWVIEVWYIKCWSCSFIHLCIFFFSHISDLHTKAICPEVIIQGSVFVTELCAEDKPDSLEALKFY